MNLRFDTTPIASPPHLDAADLASRRAQRIDPALREAFVAEGKGAEQLERLFADDALVVTTGQQPGLLTGPLFTIYKALTALVTAEAFETALGRPVVPVFWVAGDDHDLAEANHLQVLTMENEVERVALPDRSPDAPLVPLYREPLGDEIAGVLERIAATTPQTEFRSEIVAWLERHYRPASDYASAFAGATAELLGPYGLVVFRPTHATAKAVMAPRLVRALETAPQLDRRLAARARDLGAAGREPPVPVGEGASLVMIEGRLGRDRLVMDGDGFVTRRAGERFDLHQLRAVADREPERLSPNVLLRPAVEAGMLPTLAYVAGPGELAYLPQCAPVYEALGIAPQAVVPRWSARIAERRIQKVLDKYDITPDDLAGPEGKLEALLVGEEMPVDAAQALDTLRATLGREFGRLEHAAVDLDPTLKKSVQSARNSAFKELGHVEKRIVSHLKKQNEIVLNQIAKARHSLYPQGRLQERVFNIVPFLIRYGRDLLRDAYAAARAAAPVLESPSRGS
ncbi:MAG: bacillithiol biosynthesis cysteine-adding enzyme BshC [Gemmatimonadales bacterium]